MNWPGIQQENHRALLGVCALIVAVALVLGSWNALVTYQSLGREPTPAKVPARTQSATATTVERANKAPESAASAPRQATGGYFTTSPDEPSIPVRDGVAIVPSYNFDGRFEGYLVQGRSGDYRFSHGDIITAIGQTPVEDSAAGSELLLIAIAQSAPALTILKPNRR